jgi:hypothetical protein
MNALYLAIAAALERHAAHPNLKADIDAIFAEHAVAPPAPEPTGEPVSVAPVIAPAPVPGPAVDPEDAP